MPTPENSPTGNYYVALTGARMNAGDHLIKHRSLGLFLKYRPDREIITLDGWRPALPENLEVLNGARAIILCGGPAIQQEMLPKVYRVIDDLKNIHPPIVAMGLGCYCREGKWTSTRDFKFNGKTMELLERIDGSGFASSVRDYHSLNVLESHGVRGVSVTGCPALFAPEPGPVQPPAGSITSIGFSAGVKYHYSRAMADLQKEAILKIRDCHKKALLTVYFHHPINLQNPAQLDFTSWLEKNSIGFSDISGDEHRLMEVYRACDLHIGFRVHAHIYRCSIGRLSVLFAEDGRARALKETIGGSIIDGIIGARGAYTIADRLRHITGLKKFDWIDPYKYVAEDAITILNHEQRSDYPGLRAAYAGVSILRDSMKRFLLQLP